MSNLSLSIAEVIILQFGAIVLGFVIYYFLYGRSRKKYHFDETTERSSEVDLNFKYLHELEMKDKEIMKLNDKLKSTEEDIDIYEIELEERSKELKSLRLQRDTTSASDTTQLNEELRKLKGQVETAYNENKNLQTQIEGLLIEIKNLKGERTATSKSVTLSQIDELNFLRKQLAEANETNEIYQIEINELRSEIKNLRSNFESLSKGQGAGTAGKTETYYEQLQMAQQGLKQENERIGRLLEQLDIIKEKEEKEKELSGKNEMLTLELERLRQMLAEREEEIKKSEQKGNLTREMSSRLDNAYLEFNVMQDKIHKLEVQVTTSRMTSMELEDLKEAHQRMVRDYEEQKLKLYTANNEKQQYFKELTLAEEKLKEANFQRQQLQKKINYLEELNRDMQAMAETNRKLENQLRRIGELESRLNLTEEERDLLKNQAGKSSS